MTKKNRTKYKPFTLQGLRVESHECPTCHGRGVVWRAGKIKHKTRRAKGARR